VDGILRVHSDQAEVPELEIMRVAKERGKTLPLTRIRSLSDQTAVTGNPDKGA